MLFKITAVFLSFAIPLTPGPVSRMKLVREPARVRNTSQVARGEARGKAFDLLEEVVTESRTLRLPENRVFIQAAAADLLWQRDEKGARALFAEALANLDQLTDGVVQDGTESIGLAQTASELRDVLLLRIALHDSAWARRLRGALVPPSAQEQEEQEADADSGAQPITSARQSAQGSIENTDEDPALTTENAAGATAQAPTDGRDGFYADVAMKAERAGDLQRARRMANRITDQFQRRETMAAINRQYLFDAAREGKSEQTLGSLHLLRTPEERASVLCELAATLARRNDKERARELMSQARNLLANRPRNYAQVKARLKVACAFAAVDADQSFEMIGAIVNQLDELATATLTVDGFITEEQFARDGELILRQALQSLDADADDGAQDDGLALLARNEFERMKDAADKFQCAELRTLAHLRLVETVLTEGTPTQQ
jgi:hypothetical protein